MNPFRGFASILLAVCAALPLAAAVQDKPARSLYDRYTEPIGIFTNGLGSFTRPISSTSKEAQA